MVLIIHTLGGLIGLCYTVESVKRLLQPRKPNAKHLKHLIHCPKCGEPSIQVRKRGLLFKIPCAHIGTKRIMSGVYYNDIINDYYAFETHIEKQKEVIAVCLTCTHNRMPGTDITPSKIYSTVHGTVNARFTLEYYCSCRFHFFSLHDAHTGEKVEIPDGEPISDIKNLYLQCLRCNREKKFRAY